MRLQHVSTPIPPDALDKARAFYGGVLGLREKPVPETLDPARFVWFDGGAGDLELHFYVAERRGERDRRHFALEVDDLGAYRERLDRAGAEVEDARPIANRPRFYCRDPFGNLLELTQIAGAYR